MVCRVPNQRIRVGNHNYGFVFYRIKINPSFCKIGAQATVCARSEDVSLRHAELPPGVELASVQQPAPTASLHRTRCRLILPNWGRPLPIGARNCGRLRRRHKHLLAGCIETTIQLRARRGCLNPVSLCRPARRAERTGGSWRRRRTRAERIRWRRRSAVGARLSERRPDVVRAPNGA